MRFPMASAPRQLDPRDRVLLIRLGAVGDVLRTLPALHLLRVTWPELRIAWIVEELSRGLLEGHPEVDEVILLPRRELRASRPGGLLARIAALRRCLRERRFTVTLDFQGNLKSGLVALFSGAPRRIGFGPGSSREGSFLFASEWVRPSGLLNRVERNLVLAAAVGARGDEVAMILPERPEEAAGAEEIVRQAAPHDEPVVVISPGTSRRQAYKRWPPAHYARLAGLLDGAASLVVFGPGEEALADEVVRGSGGRARLAPPIGLRMLAAVLRRADLFIGADTGPMHLAWGVGCPVVALFGPTDPRLNAPLGATHAVLRDAVSMQRITPESVAAAARRLLEKRTLPRASRRMPILSRADLGIAADAGR
ncbi:MAG TPA: glycosyltransferase family 9 protein [Candidatus Polarisedimenticolia bacterium]